MAKESELVLLRTLAFDPSVFPGYRHSTTDPQVKAGSKKIAVPMFPQRRLTHTLKSVGSRFDDVWVSGILRGQELAHVLYRGMFFGSSAVL